MVTSLGTGFCNRRLKCWNLQQVTKKKCNCFFASVPWFLFLLEIFSMPITLHCLLYIFYMNNHRLICKCHVCWKISRWNVKTLVEKHSMFYCSKFGISTFQTYFIKSKPKPMVNFSSNHSLELYLPKILDQCNCVAIISDKCFPKETFTA